MRVSETQEDFYTWIANCNITSSIPIFIHGTKHNCLLYLFYYGIMFCRILYDKQRLFIFHKMGFAIYLLLNFSLHIILLQLQFIHELNKNAICLFYCIFYVQYSTYKTNVCRRANEEAKLRSRIILMRLRLRDKILVRLRLWLRLLPY
jgi:hypothetical protein